MQLLATTNGGMEAVAADELGELLGADAAVHHRGAIEFDGDLDDVYEFHCRSRSCHRLLEVLVDALVAGLEDVYDRTREAAVARHLPFADFGVDGTRHGDHVFTSVDLADRVGQAVIDAYHEATGERLPVDLDDPTVPLEAAIHDDRFTLGVDLTGESLHRRPYRACEHDAPLRPTIAHSMVRLAGYEPADRLVDPMAGSGTIAIEAALAALGRVPRPDLEPAFVALPRYDVDAFEDRRVSCRRTDPDRKPTTLDIEARDHSERWCRCARVNRDAAGLAEVVAVTVGDAREASLEADCVVTNLPFGVRVSEDLPALYGALADRLREGDVGRFVALTTKPEFLPLDPVQRHDVTYGRLDAAVVVCEP